MSQMQHPEGYKMKPYLIHLLLATVAVFAPAQGMLTTALLLIVIDLITGILASKKQGKKINSSGLQRTIVKLLVYEISIMLAFLTETYLLNHSIPVSNIVAGFVGITELKSCLENLNVISGGDLLKQIVDKLGSKNSQS